MKRIFKIDLNNGYSDWSCPTDSRLKWCKEIPNTTIYENNLLDFEAEESATSKEEVEQICKLNIWTVMSERTILHYFAESKDENICQEYLEEHKKAIARRKLKGVWLLKETSSEPKKDSNGKYIYPWRRYGKRTYCWLIPAEKYLDFTSRRIEWYFPEIFFNRKEALEALFIK